MKRLFLGLLLAGAALILTGAAQFPVSFWKTAASGGGTPSYLPTNGNVLQSEHNSVAADAALRMIETATSSGTLNLCGANDLAAGQQIKIAVYDGTAPSGIVGIATITGSGTGWDTAVMSGGTITSGHSYSICAFVSSATGNWDCYHGTGATHYAATNMGYFASPPSNADGIYNTGSWLPINYYVRFQ